MNFQISNRTSSHLSKTIKRVFDLLIATIGLIVGIPFFLVAAVLIRYDSPGPIFYRQMRVGRGGTPFGLIKFRTMVHNAEETLDDHLERDPTLRLSWEQFQKLLQDPRLTWIGRWLRKTSLDELPQLWNVVLGEMSLVGPRPIQLDQIDDYGGAYAAYTQVTPGMTGLWQVSGRNKLSFSERVQLDCEYIQNWSLWLDIIILIRTIWVVIWREGAF